MATKRKTQRKPTKRGKERRSNGRVDQMLQKPKRADWLEINAAWRWDEWIKARSEGYEVTWL